MKPFHVALFVALFVVVVFPLDSGCDSDSEYKEYRQRFLLLSTQGDVEIESTLGSARLIFNALGIPYDEFFFINKTSKTRLADKTLPTLESNGQPLYSAVIMTGDELVYQTQSGSYVSALTAEEKGTLESFEAAHHIRRVVLSSWPITAYGVQLYPSTTSGTSSFSLRFAQPSAEYLKGVNHTLVLNDTLWHVKGQMVNPSVATPVLYFDTPSDAIAAITCVVQGREQFHLFVAQSSSKISSVVLSVIWVQWVSRGTYVGSRRILFWTQMDDVFKAAYQWEPDLLGLGTVPYRTFPSDLHWNAEWAKNITKWLDETGYNGSYYRIGMPFNGKGVYDRGYTYDPVLITCNELKADYWWLSHTFSHMSLTRVDQDPTHCAGRKGLLGNVTSYFDASCEFTRNYEAGDLIMGTDCASKWQTAPGRKECETYSPNSMVNPMISGLLNKFALKAMWDAGIRYIVGDNTEPETQGGVADNEYHGFYTANDTHGYPGILIIPRFATEIYYNSATVESNVAQFNERNRDWAGNQTLEGIMQIEVDRVLPYLLSFRPDGYMFHQTNLIVVSYKGRKGSLLAFWVEPVLQKLREYYTLPVISRRQNDLGRLLAERMHRDKNCTYTVSLAYHRTKDVLMGMNITSSDSCVVGVTGVRGLPSAIARVEDYGPDVTTWVTLSPGSLFVPVNVSVSVIPFLGAQELFVGGVEWTGVSGQPSIFHVHVGHPLGPGTRPVSGLAARFSAAAKGPLPAGTQTSCSMSDNGNGTYTVAFLPSVAGNYSVSVLFDGVTVPGTPVVKTVTSFVPQPTPSPCVASSNLRESRLRILLLSATGSEALEPSLGVARLLFQMQGIPFDEHHCIDPVNRTRADNCTLPTLVDACTGATLYSGTVFSTYGLVYDKKDGTFPYAWTNEEDWQLLKYEWRYKVRRVVLDSRPIVQIGMGVFEASGSASTAIYFDANAGDALAGVNATARLEMTGVWHSPAKLRDTRIAKPFAYFETPQGSIAGALVTLDDREQLHFFTMQVKTYTYAKVLGIVWTNWLTRGQFVGSRRLRFWTEVDDFLMRVNKWDPQTQKVDSGVVVRCTPDDLNWHVSWMSRVNEWYGPGSAYKPELAFSGYGVHQLLSDYKQDPLMMHAAAIHGKFFWVSHTYSHAHLTTLDQDPSVCVSTVTGQQGQSTPYVVAACEIEKNFGAGDVIAGNNSCASKWNETQGKSACASYASQGLVTPSISGLTNPNALKAMRDHGSLYVAGNNYDSTLKADNPYHPVELAVEADGADRIVVVPRYAVDIYSSCVEPADNEGLYNYFNAATLGKNLTFAEILEKEANKFLPFLLQFHHVGFGFHQANLVTFDWADSLLGSGKASLLSLWVESTLKALRQYLAFPVLSQRLDELGGLFVERKQRDSCNYTVSLAYHRTKDVLMGMNITSSDSCVVGVTGVRGLPSAIARVEDYGPDVTTWVTLSPGSLFVPVDVDKSVVPVNLRDTALQCNERQVCVSIAHPLGPGLRNVSGLSSSFVVTLTEQSGGTSVGCVLQHRGDGQYCCALKCVGTYLVNVKYQGSHVQGSPFSAVFTGPSPTAPPVVPTIPSTPVVTPIQPCTRWSEDVGFLSAVASVAVVVWMAYVFVIWRKVSLLVSDVPENIAKAKRVLALKFEEKTESPLLSTTSSSLLAYATVAIMGVLGIALAVVGPVLAELVFSLSLVSCADGHAVWAVLVGLGLFYFCGAFFLGFHGPFVSQEDQMDGDEGAMPDSLISRELVRSFRQCLVGRRSVMLSQAFVPAAAVIGQAIIGGIFFGWIFGGLVLFWGLISAVIFQHVLAVDGRTWTNALLRWVNRSPLPNQDDAQPSPTKPADVRNSSPSRSSDKSPLSTDGRGSRGAALPMPNSLNEVASSSQRRDVEMKTSESPKRLRPKLFLEPDDGERSRSAPISTSPYRLRPLRSEAEVPESPGIGGMRAIMPAAPRQPRGPRHLPPLSSLREGHTVREKAFLEEPTFAMPGDLRRTKTEGTMPKQMLAAGRGEGRQATSPRARLPSLGLVGRGRGMGWDQSKPSAFAPMPMPQSSMPMPMPGARMPPMPLGGGRIMGGGVAPKSSSFGMEMESGMPMPSSAGRRGGVGIPFESPSSGVGVEGQMPMPSFARR